MKKSNSLTANFRSLYGGKGEDGQPASVSDPASVSPPPPARVAAGIVGAARRSVTEIREERDRLLAERASHGVADVNVSIIDPSPFPDRIADDNSEAFDQLVDSIRSDGQKVPIQIRVSPEDGSRYQVVYGHRRLRAAMALGPTVKAVVVNLTDSELVVAQGIENSARQDLSWIERAVFAWRLEEAGIDMREIRAALNTDKTELSRFRSVCRVFPIEVIELIGRSPSVGRNRWLQVLSEFGEVPGVFDKMKDMLAGAKARGMSSDERFAYVFEALKAAPAQRTAKDLVELRTPAGSRVGRVQFGEKGVRLSVDGKHAPEFSSFLRKEIPALMERFSEHLDGGEKRTST